MSYIILRICFCFLHCCLTFANFFNEESNQKWIISLSSIFCHSNKQHKMHRFDNIYFMNTRVFCYLCTGQIICNGYVCRGVARQLLVGTCTGSAEMFMRRCRIRKLSLINVLVSGVSSWCFVRDFRLGRIGVGSVSMTALWLWIHSRVHGDSRSRKSPDTDDRPWSPVGRPPHVSLNEAKYLS